MKKQFVIVAAVCALTCCLGACDWGKKPQNHDPEDRYEALNDMLDASYSKIVLTVTNTFDESASLVSEYTIAHADGAVKVQYSVERFAEIGDPLTAPLLGEKETLTGEAVIRDGALTFTGDDVGLTPDFADTRLTFAEQVFDRIALTETSLKADVVKPGAFLGSQIMCTNMHVEAAFGEVFSKIDITYTAADGSTVEYLFLFTP